MKTYTETACDLITAMINRGLITVVAEKGDDWRKRNYESLHTVGWAVLEMVRELKSIPRQLEKPPKKPTRLIQAPMNVKVRG